MVCRVIRTSSSKPSATRYASKVSCAGSVNRARTTRRDRRARTPWCTSGFSRPAWSNIQAKGCTRIEGYCCPEIQFTTLACGTCIVSSVVARLEGKYNALHCLRFTRVKATTPYGQGTTCPDHWLAQVKCDVFHTWLSLGCSWGDKPKSYQ